MTEGSLKEAAHLPENSVVFAPKGAALFLTNEAALLPERRREIPYPNKTDKNTEVLLFANASVFFCKKRQAERGALSVVLPPLGSSFGERRARFLS